MSLSYLLSLLPLPLAQEIRSHPLVREGDALSEIRLRQALPSSLSFYSEGTLQNAPLAHRASAEELSRTLSLAADGSVYAHEESLREGFLSMKNGIRVGVCGRAVPDGRGGIKAICAVTSLVFRLPHKVPRAADALCAFFEESRGGILLFAPPGGGKTTQLRELIRTLGTRYRIAAIDTREELAVTEDALLLDRLASYPKAKGAEIAVRTLSPEILVLDEVGREELAALCALVSFGVRTVASIHAESAEAVRRSPSLAPLLKSSLFSHLWDVRGRRAFPLWEAGA